MSHITKVKTRLKDGQVLRQVLRDLRYNVYEGGIISSPYGEMQRQAVEFVAIKRGRRIGFNRSEGNGIFYEMLADWQVMNKSKKVISNEIFQAYSCEKVIQAARRKGYSVMRNSVNRAGQVEISLRKVA